MKQLQCRLPDTQGGLPTVSDWGQTASFEKPKNVPQYLISKYIPFVTLTIFCKRNTKLRTGFSDLIRNHPENILITHEISYLKVY